MHLKLPRIQVDQNNISISPNKFVGLSIHHIPLLFNYQIYENTVILDPTKGE